MHWIIETIKTNLEILFLNYLIVFYFLQTVLVFLLNIYLNDQIY